MIDILIDDIKRELYNHEKAYIISLTDFFYFRKDDIIYVTLIFNNNIKIEEEDFEKSEEVIRNLLTKYNKDKVKINEACFRLI